MAATSTELKKLQQQVNELQILHLQVNQLQKRVTQLEKEKSQKRRSVRKPGSGLSERERAIELLRRTGVTRELTPKEKQLAARGRALSAKEKAIVNRELRQVRIDPPLSQLIHDAR